MTTGSDPLDEKQELSISFDKLEETYTALANASLEPSYAWMTVGAYNAIKAYFSNMPKPTEEDDFDDFAEWAKDVRAKHKRPKNGELRQYLDKQAGKRGRRF